MKALVAPWLEPSDPRALAIRRLIIWWVAWPGLRLPSLRGLTEFEDSAAKPVGILKLLGGELPSPQVLEAASIAFSATSALALLGLFYRVTGPAAALLALFLQTALQSAGKVNHGTAVFALSLCVIGASRAADAWSVDAWLARRRKNGARPKPSAEYRWPVRFIALLVCAMYGAAGLTKLLTSGWAWAFGESLQRRLLAHHFTHDPPTRLGVWLADYPTLCEGLAAAAMALELAAPLALLHRYAYRSILPGLALLQLFIWLCLGVVFKEMIPVFLCLLPWERAFPRER
jgi:hypothetical protein